MEKKICGKHGSRYLAAIGTIAYEARLACAFSQIKCDPDRSTIAARRRLGHDVAVVIATGTNILQSNSVQTCDGFGTLDFIIKRD